MLAWLWHFLGRTGMLLLVLNPRRIAGAVEWLLIVLASGLAIFSSYFASLVCALIGD